VADILEEKRDAFARQMTVEMGRPIRAAREEVTKCAWCCRFYGDHAERWLADESVATSAGSSFIRYEPLGPVLAIMPWNFPFWQVVRTASWARHDDAPPVAADLPAGPISAAHLASSAEASAWHVC
jgi:acyl-CoA reductase-like NAD-dependent aldehyde dehydrogenase